MKDHIYRKKHSTDPTHPRHGNHIQFLRQKYGDALAANILGMHVRGLNAKDQPLPVLRLAYLLWRLINFPQKPITIFDLLTLGRFDRDTTSRSLVERLEPPTTPQ